MAQFVSEVTINANALPQIRNDVNYEMITEATFLSDNGFTLDLNLFFLESELHGNLTLNTKNMKPDQDVYMGFIFKHAEPLEIVTRTDDELFDEPVEVEARPKGFDGMRSKVSFTRTDFEKAFFTVTDLWYDSETVPDLWGKGVLGDHLYSDPLAHDWVIIKEDSYISCEKENCQINVRFKRDFDTFDLRDHKIKDGEE
jgi:hypothetical protein